MLPVPDTGKTFAAQLPHPLPRSGPGGWYLYGDSEAVAVRQFDDLSIK